MRERLLVRHFLQRFVDNDLISPHADRHEIFSVVCAASITAGLFVSVLLSLKYLLDPFQTPWRTAVTALDDRFFYIAASMIVMGLVAVAEWDALVLDTRDASILGPLPIPLQVLVRAKLTTVVLFGAGFAVVLNAVPSIVHPALMVAKLPIGIPAALALFAVHAVVTFAAGAFGFVSVLAFRELLRALLGHVRFAAVSWLAQGVLMVLLGASFLLLPAGAVNVARAWLASDAMSVRCLPPLWFLGLHERLAAGLMTGLPSTELPGTIQEWETDAALLYNSLLGTFQQFSEVAVAALATSTVIALGAYVWNSRRLPSAPASGADRLGRGLFASVASAFAARGTVGRAAYYFTLRVLRRSVPHRASMAAYAAASVAIALLTVRGIDLRQPVDVAAIPPGILALQTVFVSVLMVGFRHAVRVPAELGANWIFQLTTSRDERPFLIGVKRAAVVALALPTLVAWLPLHLWLLGARAALAHFAFGLLLALVLLEALLLGFRRLPFTFGYTPNGNLRFLGPLYILAFATATYLISRAEQLALASTSSTIALLAVMVTLVAALRTLHRWSRHEEVAIEFDEMPASTQRLDLSG